MPLQKSFAELFAEMSAETEERESKNNPLLYQNDTIDLYLKNIWNLENCITKSNE